MDFTLLWLVAASLAGLVLLLFLAITAYFYLLHRKYAHIPCPQPCHFYFGHLPTIVKIIKAGSHQNLLYIDWYHQCGPVFVVWILNNVIVEFLDPKVVKELAMNLKLYKPAALYDKLSYVYGERFLGTGLLTEPRYEVWKPRRCLYDPSFNKTYLKHLVPSFNKCVDSLVARLQEKADGQQQILMKQEFSEITLDIIGKVAFGVDLRNMTEVVGSQSSTLDQLMIHLKNILEGIQYSFYFFFYEYVHPRKTRSYQHSVRTIRKLGRQCIESRIKSLESGDEVPADILSQILRMTNGVTDVSMEDLLDDFSTFYLAGQETTGNLLSFTLIMLIQHPNVLARVCEEISEVLQGEDYVSAEALEKLQYMMQVLQETHRLYPTVGGMARQSSEDITLAGYKIPKGTTLGANTFGACRLSNNFENPEVFDPARFGPEQLKPDPFVYFPFGRGHRSCIGQNFALIEVRIILARLLQKFSFSLPKDYQVKMVIRTTLQPKDDVACTVLCRS